MKPHLTLVTLGVRDLARARGFYCDGLGGHASSSGNESVVFIQAGGVALGLFGRDALAEDAHLSPEGSGFSGITLATNLGSRADVDAWFAKAEAAGAKVLKRPEEVFWGGYSGYFADPDGHVWEVAHNPFWPLTADGRVVLPE